MLKHLLAAAAMSLLAACSVSPYYPGKSAADVPAQVKIIGVKQAYVTSGAAETNGEPPPDPSPSDSDLEVLAVAKASLIAGLTEAGYKLVDDPQAACDIGMKLTIYYQPERWPLIQRSIFVIVLILGPDGEHLFRAAGVRFNNFGLIGAIAGPSRDDAVAATARDAVEKLVGELHNGKKQNTPVSFRGTPVARQTQGPRVSVAAPLTIPAR